MSVSPSARHSDVAILCALLDHGPATLKQIGFRVRRQKSAVTRAVNRLAKDELVRYCGYAPDRPGRVGPLPRLIEIGPRITTRGTASREQRHERHRGEETTHAQV